MKLEILKFYSPTCMPCKQLEVILENLNFDYDIEITNVDITSDVDAALQWQVRSVPTLVNKANGSAVVGAEFGKIEDWINDQIRLQS